MKFEVDGTEYEFVQSPTFGEARAIEKVTGEKFAEMAGGDGVPSLDYLQGVVWISMKRVKPETTFDDIDDIDMGVLTGMLTELQAAAEKSAGKASGARATKR